MMRSTLRRLVTILPWVVATLLPAQAQTAAAQPAESAAIVSERLTVADPYLEMRTGPGRGYPVFLDRKSVV